MKQRNTHTMKATAQQTSRRAPNGEYYYVVPTEWGWFVKGTDGYNSSDGGDYYATKAQAMKRVSECFAMIRLEMKHA